MSMHVHGADLNLGSKLPSRSEHGYTLHVDPESYDQVLEELPRVIGSDTYEQASQALTTTRNIYDNEAIGNNSMLRKFAGSLPIIDNGRLDYIEDGVLDLSDAQEEGRGVCKERSATLFLALDEISGDDTDLAYVKGIYNGEENEGAHIWIKYDDMLVDPGLGQIQDYDSAIQGPYTETEPEVTHPETEEVIAQAETVDQLEKIVEQQGGIETSERTTKTGQDVREELEKLSMSDGEVEHEDLRAFTRNQGLRDAARRILE